MENKTREFIKNNTELIDDFLLDNFYDRLFDEGIRSSDTAEVTKLLQAAIPDMLKYVTAIYPGMFYRYTEKTVDIHSDITVIYADAFEKSLIEYIEIPSSVEQVCEGAFADCTLLKKVYIENKRTKIDSIAFDGCNSIEVMFNGYPSEINSSFRYSILSTQGIIYYKDGSSENIYDI